MRDPRLPDARHTAATVLLILGVPDRAVMEIMGWSTPRWPAVTSTSPEPSGPISGAGRRPSSADRTMLQLVVGLCDPPADAWTLCLCLAGRAMTVQVGIEVSNPSPLDHLIRFKPLSRNWRKR